MIKGKHRAGWTCYIEGVHRNFVVKNEVRYRGVETMEELLRDYALPEGVLKKGFYIKGDNNTYEYIDEYCIPQNIKGDAYVACDKMKKLYITSYKHIKSIKTPIESLHFLSFPRDVIFEEIELVNSPCYMTMVGPDVYSVIKKDADFYLRNTSSRLDESFVLSHDEPIFDLEDFVKKYSASEKREPEYYSFMLTLRDNTTGLFRAKDCMDVIKTSRGSYTLYISLKRLSVLGVSVEDFEKYLSFINRLGLDPLYTTGFEFIIGSSRDRGDCIKVLFDCSKSKPFVNYLRMILLRYAFVYSFVKLFNEIKQHLDSTDPWAVILEANRGFDTNGWNIQSTGVFEKLPFDEYLELVKNYNPEKSFTSLLEKTT